jgi:hypothetical protein
MRSLTPIVLLAALLAAPAAAQMEPRGYQTSPLADRPQIDSVTARIDVLASHLKALAAQMTSGAKELEGLDRARPAPPGLEAKDEALARYRGVLGRWQEERGALAAKLEALAQESVAREKELARLSSLASADKRAEVAQVSQAAQRARQLAQDALKE